MSEVIIDIIEGRGRDLGGFSVRRVLPVGHCKMIGPFIFFDHLGPVRMPAGTGMDVRPHPHIGLATVTYLFEGRIMHRDSLGSAQMIEPGAVNWMTAGRGIAHSERSPAEDRVQGPVMHGIQSWVALPLAEEEIAPAFAHHPAQTLPTLRRDGVTLRVIAGEAYGLRSPVALASPMFYVEAQLDARARLQVPGEYSERAIYMVDAAIEIAGRRYEAGRMLVLAAGAEVEFTAPEGGRVMLLGGAALEGERHIFWNFVSSRPQRIEEAKQDWSAQRFARVPGETEFIPLPGERK